MRLAPRLVIWAAACLLTGSCENLGAGIDIVNRSTEKLYLFTTAIPPDGGRLRIETPDCSHANLDLRTKDGRVFARLTEERCPGQTWVITGEGTSSLEDD